MKMIRTKGAVFVEETGELATQTQIKQHDFVMVYLDALVKLTAGVKIQADVLFELLKLKTKKDNIIFLSTSRKKNISEVLGISMGHISVVLDRLVKAGIFKRLSRGEYLVSPYCFSNVGWTELVRLKMAFDAVSSCGDEDEKKETSISFDVEN